METQEHPAIDPRLVERQITEAQTRFERSPGRWIAGRLLMNWTVFFAITMVLPTLFDGEPERLLDFPGRSAWIGLLGPLGMAIFLTALELRRIRRQGKAGAAYVARRIERDWRKMTDPGWALRTVLLGIGMGALIGVSVGTLIAVLSPADELPSGSRVLLGLSFTGMTLLWTIPTAFVIRWLSLRSYRRLRFSE